MKYSIHYNTKQRVWIGKIKKENEWQTKWLPKSFKIQDEIPATQWLLNFLQEKPTELKPKKTLAVYAPRWLELRKNDNGTKTNTYRGLLTNINNWILDGKKHYRIADLDLETDFTVPVVRSWISTIDRGPTSILGVIGTLRAFFNDLIAEGWLNEEMSNPLDKPAVKRIEQALRQENRRIKRANGGVQSLSLEECELLLSGRASKRIKDRRRVVYLLALSTGMRDHEICGLVWSDINFDLRTIEVNRQLDKIGCLPILSYHDLIRQIGKEEIQRLPNAVCSLPKRDSIRVLPMTELLFQALRWWKEAGWRIEVGRQPKEEDPVFARSKVSLAKGKAGDFCFSESAELLRKDLEAVGVRSSHTFHGLRRTFASLLDSTAVEESRISQLLGHNAGSVARKHYLSFNLELLKDAVTRLPFQKVALSGMVVEADKNR